MKHPTTWITIGILVIASILGMIWISMDEKEPDYITGNLTTGNFTNNPRNIIFNADEIIFKDGNITITWNESGVLFLERFDNMIFNIGNKSFRYAIVSGVEE